MRQPPYATGPGQDSDKMEATTTPYTMTETQLNSYEPDNIVTEQLPPVFSGFLISFMVDARGGAMRGCRHQGVRIIIPPGKAVMPTRVTCRLVKKEKLLHPPPLMEGEGLASRLLEMGPCGTTFLGPVVIEVPHFASMRGKEREVIIMRSDNGETWREQPMEATEEAVQAALGGSFEDLESAEDLYQKRITRILTTDFPQYFAIISRVREETNHIGSEGGTISSTVIPQVQAVFPEGALTKKIKVGLQAQQIPADQVAKLLGNRVAVSPIVTVEPRRRKFHKPITLTIPLPKASQKGMINQYAGDAPTLRLLCSITGGTSPAQWEDLTGTTPLTFQDDCVSFTTAVSARFWLMDCQTINEAAKMATELYREAICVPYMSKFVIFAKRHESQEARLRCFCMTDDKMDKTLESQEHYVKVAESRDVEVLENRSAWIEMAGNLVPVTKSGEQLHLPFRAFRENRLPFTVRVRDNNQDSVARVAFMRDPKQQRGEAPQTPICSLNIQLPDYVKTEDGEINSEAADELRMKYRLISGEVIPENITKADMRLSDIADTIQGDWVLLAQHLSITDEEVIEIKKKYNTLSDQCLAMLVLWKKKFGDDATGNALEKALKDINRDDVIRKCMYNLDVVSDDVERAYAKMQLEQQSAGFEDLKEELGVSRDSTIERNQMPDIQLEDQDMMKESESAGEESPSSPSSVVENKEFPKGAEDTFVASYDEYKDVKPQTNEEREEDTKKKKSAYLDLIDKLGTITAVEDNDLDIKQSGQDEPTVEEEQFERAAKDHGPEEDFMSRVERLDDQAPMSMDDRMSISSDEHKGKGPDYDEIAARLSDEFIDPDHSAQTKSAPHESALDFTENMPDLSVPTDEPEIGNIKIQTEVIKSEPKTETDVQEFEETMPDGTVVKRRVTKTKTTQDVKTRIRLEGYGVDDLAIPAELDMDNGDTIEGEPEIDTDVEEFEEVLEDGTLVRRKVIKTRTTQSTTTKIVSDSSNIDDAGSSDVTQ